jgi:hypothetical protein
MIDALIHWLYVNVVGNLTASALWATPALIHLHRKINRNQRTLMGAKDSPGTVAGQFELSDQYNDGAPIGFGLRIIRKPPS